MSKVRTPPRLTLAHNLYLVSFLVPSVSMILCSRINFTTSRITRVRAPHRCPFFLLASSVHSAFTQSICQMDSSSSFMVLPLGLDSKELNTIRASGLHTSERDFHGIVPKAPSRASRRLFMNWENLNSSISETWFYENLSSSTGENVNWPSVMLDSRVMQNMQVSLGFYRKIVWSY